MKSIQGFVSLSGYINNTPGTVAEFFELSPLALTYSKERGEYQDADYPGYVLHTFKAVDIAVKTKFSLPDTQVKEILAVTHAVKAYMDSASYPYDLIDLQNTVSAQFSQSIHDLVIGAFFVGTSKTLSESISWTSLTHVDTEVKVWLRTEAFENQFSDFEIVTVPPIDLLDRFFGTYGDLAALLSAITITDTVDRVETFRNDHPETYLRVHSFDFINRSNSAQSCKVPWGTLIYGKNGDNIDSIKDALVTYILANSSHSQTEWEVIFPDLFKRTEFVFYPRWDKIAIPNLTSLGAIYSSAMDPVETVSFAESVWPDVNASFISKNLTVLPFDYKAISVVALNGVSNLAARATLMSLFPDFIPVSTSSLDFNRMSIYTQEWLLMMVELIKIAETATEFTTIKSPYRRVIRGNTVYITCVYDSVNYLVATRSSIR